MAGAVHCQLWMGSLEPYMTESFILAAFRRMGEEPTTVRLMRNKFTGEPAAYCFVNFATDSHAIDAMHKLNGKPIPGTNPIVRFRLNSAGNSYKAPGADRDFSVWVGDLSPEVDDYQLYKVFSAKYNSIKSAKVILDSSGFSKGYGFVRFGIEGEQKIALYEMNGYIGLGSKPIKICNAVPKPKSELGIALGNNNDFSYGAADNVGGAEAAASDYVQQYERVNSYWNGCNLWQGYYDQHGGTYYQQPMAAMHSDPQTLAQHAVAWSAQRNAQYENERSAAAQAAVVKMDVSPDDDNTLVNYKSAIDVDQMNLETLENDRLLYDALESSKWRPIEQLENF